MTEKDRKRIEFIYKHAQEIRDALLSINYSFDDFSKNTTTQKAILFDLLQIGENLNQLSEETLMQIPKETVYGAISTRNAIVHGYGRIDQRIVWDTIIIDLPVLLEDLCDKYSFIGKFLKTGGFYIGKFPITSLLVIGNFLFLA